MNTTTFSWRNYSKPTPQNFLRLSKLIKRILYGVSTASLFQENHWVTGGLIFLLPITDELVQFFADASNDANVINIEGQTNHEPEIVLDHSNESK